MDKKFKPEYLTILFVLWEVIGIVNNNTFIIVSGLIILVVMFAMIRKEKETNNDKTSKLATMIFKQYQINKYHIGSDLLSAIGINKSQNKIVFLSRKKISDEFKSRQISFNELLEVKLLEDDITVTGTSRASQLGGALVGGVVAGGVGAIIGGVGGTQHSEKKVKSIQLQCVIDDLNTPIHTISFLNEDVHIGKYEKKYKTQFEVANNWYKMFSVVLKRNEKLSNTV